MSQTDSHFHKNKGQPSGLKKVLVLIAFCVIVIAGLLYASYPKMTVTMAVIPSIIDSKGNLIGYTKFQSVMKQRGIELRFKQTTTEPSVLELAIKDPTIDFLLATNSGAVISTDLKDDFSSLGVIRKIPIFILAHAGKPKISHLSELRGQSIALRAAPNSGTKEAFTENRLSPQQYQPEYIYSDLFALLDINFKNTKFINTYPEPAFAAPHADYYFGFYSDGQIGSVNDFPKKIETEKYSFVNLVDIEGVARNSKAIFAGQLEASALWPQLAIPSESVSYMYVTQSAVVRRNLDPSLILVLSEAIQSEASSSTKFSKHNELPRFADSELFSPTDIAKDYYKNGKPFLTDYFSPMVAALLIKIIIILVPILTLLWPISNLVPKIYSFYIKNKISHWYVDLEMIDKSLGSADAETRKKYSEIIDNIAQSITEMRLPIFHSHYVQELFTARSNVNLIRTKLNELKKLAPATSTIDDFHKSN
jgi:hypothetical protein